MTSAFEHLALALFFLGCLLFMVHRLRRSSETPTRGALHTAFGLTALSAVALVKYMGHSGLASSVLAGHDTGVFQIAGFFGTALGLVLLVSGGKAYLREHADRQVDRERRFRLLETMRYLEQLGRVEHRVSHLAQVGLDRLQADTRIHCAALYVVSGVRGTLHLAAAAPLERGDHLSCEILAPHAPAFTALSAQHDSQPETPGGFDAAFGQPNLTVPLVVDSRTVGFLVVWVGEKQPLSCKETRDIQALGDLLARHVERQFRRGQWEYAHRCAVVRDKLAAIEHASRSLRASLADLATLLRTERLGDQLSVAIENNACGYTQVVTFSGSGATLIEKLPGECDARFSQILRQVGPSLSRIALAENQPLPGGLGAIRSLVGCRVWTGRSTNVSILIGRTASRPVDAPDTALLNEACRMVSRILAQAHGALRVRRERRYRRLLDAFIAMALNTSPDVVLRVGSKITRVETGASNVLLVPVGARQSLVSSESHTELRGVYSKSVQNLPVRVDGQLAAWLQLSFAGGRRITQSTRQFVSAIASIMLLVSRYRGPAHVTIEAPMRSQVRAALGGIIGSLELMGRAEPSDAQRRNRCLELIDRSARRLQSCLEYSELSTHSRRAKVIR